MNENKPTQFVIHVWGDRACFTRPDQTTERSTYDIPTPAAIRGFCESIFFREGIRYVVDRIEVLSPIMKEEETCNEVDFRNGNPDQRTTVYLSRVEYRWYVHLERISLEYSYNYMRKCEAMLERRLKRSEMFYTPYLGTSECLAHWEFGEGESPKPPIRDTRSFGRMTYDYDYNNQKRPLTYDVRMVQGVVTLPSLDAVYADNGVELCTR